MTAPTNALPGLNAAPTPAPSAASSGAAVTRALAAVGLVGAPAFLVQFLAAGARAPAGPPPRGDVPTLVACTVYIAGFLASAVALRRLRATGRGRGAAVVFAVQLALLVLAATQQVQDATNWRPFGERGYFVSDMSWPLSHTYMLVVGVAALRARVLAGWRRWAPLACGLVLPLSLVAAAGGGHAAMGWVFLPGTALAFSALAVAAATARPAHDAA
jgi:hypothetical protein